MKKEENELSKIITLLKGFVKRDKTRTRIKYILYAFIVLYIVGLVSVAVKDSNFAETYVKKQDPFVAEIKLSGVIEDGGDISADKSLKLLRKAFKAENSKAIILRLNSPGGSPVQSNQIYNGILRLKKEFDKKVYVVIDDLCASGCYYIAASADEIYADNSSIIGSIGVVMSGFGAVDAIKKLGIERRVYTAGKHKSLMDSFTNEDNEIISHIQKNILDKSHQNFINAIKATRGDKLSTKEDLFTGLIWLAEDAKKYGLIDGIADTHTVANDIIGIDNIVKYEFKKTLVEALIGSTSKGVSLMIKEQLFSKPVLN